MNQTPEKSGAADAVRFFAGLDCGDAWPKVTKGIARAANKQMEMIDRLRNLNPARFFNRIWLLESLSIVLLAVRQRDADEPHDL